MGMSAEKYAQQARALLPRGPIWRPMPGSVFSNMLLAIADTFFRLHTRIESLRTEADPRFAIELLPEWESFVGLPDPCVPEPISLSQRRNAVVARLVASGGASRDYFIALAAVYGYTVTISELATNHVRMNSVEDVAVTYFRAGSARAGDRLQTWGNHQLECLINRVKPAHVIFDFAYGI